jgi:hypothetical protein
MLAVKRLYVLSTQVRLYGFDQVRREDKGHVLVGKADDPYGVECLGYITENRACEPLLAKVSGSFFSEAGQLQG